MPWTITGNGLVVWWPKNGGLVEVLPLPVAGNGDWGEFTIPGLTSGDDYNVVVQISVVMGNVQKVVATPPAVARAK